MDIKILFPQNEIKLEVGEKKFENIVYWIVFKNHSFVLKKYFECLYFVNYVNY